MYYFTLLAGIFLHLIVSMPTIQGEQQSHHSTHTITQNNHHPQKKSTKKTKKKIAVLTSKGGNGHMAASNALKDIFSKEYDIVIINPFDRLRKGKWDGENMYNWLLQNEWIRFVNFFCYNFVPPLIRRYRRKLEQHVLHFLHREQPDLLISVIPYINLAISNAAHKVHIPFLLITTDTDLLNWLPGLKKLCHKNYLVTIGFDIPQSRNKLRKEGIPNNRIITTGFPIRPDFTEKKNKEAIKNKWNIPKNKFVIMLLMGGAGSNTLYSYADQIFSMNENIHILACAGKNERLKRKLSKLSVKQKKSPVTMTIIPFTKRISDLMAISDLLITKAGPGSINEAIHMNLPMLIDRTGPVLQWEKTNIQLVQKHGFGNIVKYFRRLDRTIKKHMYDKTFYRTLKNNLYRYPKKNFQKNISRIIHSMCPPHTNTLAPSNRLL